MKMAENERKDTHLIENGQEFDIHVKNFRLIRKSNKQILKNAKQVCGK